MAMFNYLHASQYSRYINVDNQCCWQWIWRMDYQIKKHYSVNTVMRLYTSMNFFIGILRCVRKGASDWDCAMYDAITYGFISLVKFFIDKGGSLFFIGIRRAIELDNLELVKYLVNTYYPAKFDCVDLGHFHKEAVFLGRTEISTFLYDRVTAIDIYYYNKLLKKV